MTKQRTFKRRVRGRMAKTGESYSTARRRLLSKASSPFRTRLASQPALDEVVALDSVTSNSRRRLLDWRRTWVRRSTGIPIDAWIGILDEAGARGLRHREIWHWLGASGQVSDGAVREGIVIIYEQHIGRRVIGQSCDGDYPAQVTKRLKGTMDQLLDQWLQLVTDKRVLNGAGILSEPSVSRTDKFRYWRAKLADGTTVAVTIYGMSDGRAAFGIQQRGFRDRPSADASRAYWKQFIAPLESEPIQKSEVQ